MKKPYFRCIGDVHGKLKSYVELASEAEYSLCVGDVGFHYDYLIENLDPTRHKCIGGNHDNYTRGRCACDGGKCQQCEERGYAFEVMSPHFLKDFGTWEIPDFHKIFYVRGAWSIDKAWRVDGVSWWKDEELTYEQFVKAIEAYEKTRPNFVVTHTIPQCIVPYLPLKLSKLNTPRTEQALENMWQLHKPDTWIFGHWHVDCKIPVQGTEFICLNELKYIDFDKA